MKFVTMMSTGNLTDLFSMAAFSFLAGTGRYARRRVARGRSGNVCMIGGLQGAVGISRLTVMDSNLLLLN